MQTWQEIKKSSLQTSKKIFEEDDQLYSAIEKDWQMKFITGLSFEFGADPHCEDSIAYSRLFAGIGEENGAISEKESSIVAGRIMCVAYDSELTQATALRVDQSTERCP